MKNLKMLSFVLLLLVSTMSLRAQITAPIVAEPIVTEQPATTTGQPATAATVETQVGGILAYLISNGTITVSGPRVSGGTSTVSISLSPYTGPGNGRILTAVFPLQGSGTESDEVTFTIKLRRIGNGLDYTYSRVGRIKRNLTGI
jgi:hypothetical protein